MHPSWKPLFDQYEFDLEVENGTIVFPPKKFVFRVFEMDVKDIRVVLLGQDPYHNPGQAHGLSFSVPKGIPAPPSLANIFKEIIDEYPERQYKFDHKNGNLELWFKREKIFLLNASLTVVQNQPGSHMDYWQEFTNDVIKFISENNNKCIFLLLGNFAKGKEAYISDKQRIIKGTHPSPMAAHHGFFGSGIFKKVENKLGQTIDWNN